MWANVFNYFCRTMGAYKRKTQQQAWDVDNMQRAIQAVRNNVMGLKRAANEFGVPRSTLQRRCRRNDDDAAAAEKVLGRFRPVFSQEMELQLVNHIKRMEGMLFGFTLAQLRRLAFDFADANGIDHPFNRTTQEAGKDWAHQFMARHRDTISLRTPEPTSAARARSFNRENVGSFFNLLEKVQDTNKFSPDRIYNVDETGITTVANRPSKIVATRGKKQVGSLSSAERGQLVTVEICMNAAGFFVPPLFIFPRKRMKDELMENSPPGSIAVPHESGWMQSHIFVSWFEHFLKHANPSADRPVLLILDGHKTHTNNLPFIELARSKFVTVLCLPPHCSHRMQPLDVSFMKPLMTFYTQAIENWLRNHPGRVVTTYQVAELFTVAYTRAATPTNAINGFKKTGIWPIDSMFLVMKNSRLLSPPTLLASLRPFLATLKILASLRLLRANLRPFLASRRPFLASLMLLRASLRPFVASLRLLRASLRTLPASLRLLRASLRPIVASLRPFLASPRFLRASLMPFLASLRLLRASLRPFLASPRFLRASLRPIVASLRLLRASLRPFLASPRFLRACPVRHRQPTQSGTLQ